MALSNEELRARLKEGFSDDYWEDFGSMICYQPGPGEETICPACKEVCNKWIGHKKCQETYQRAFGGLA